MPYKRMDKSLALAVLEELPKNIQAQFPMDTDDATDMIIHIANAVHRISWYSALDQQFKDSKGGTFVRGPRKTG